MLMKIHSLDDIKPYLHPPVYILDKIKPHLTPSVYRLDEIKRRIQPIFRKHKIKKAILFGSYAKGEATVRSDIDLLVESNLRGLDFIGFIEELCDFLNKGMDVFDITHIEPESRIDREIKKTGVTIYEG